jgi:HEXXH motif-containing protein
VSASTSGTLLGDGQWFDGVIAATHGLSPQELQALVTGEGLADALEKLRTAELSKHKVLLAAIMRTAARVRAADPEGRLPAAYRLLAEIEARDPAAVREVLASPQFGAWAADCAGRLWAAGADREAASTLAPGLARLAVFAAAAGFRSGRRFEIEVPLDDGAVSLPGLGTARPGAPAALSWGRASHDERGGRVSSPVSSVPVPASGDRTDADDRWTQGPRITLDARGLLLDVELDDRDPFLDRYGSARSTLSRDDVRAWRGLLAQAWTVLTRDHHPLAAVIAGTVRTLVPLSSPSPTRSAGSTDTAAFGAVALSLRADPLAMAEALVHESHHAVLGAIMDITPMLAGGQDFLAYAPWRDDPRPTSSLLHGVYTHYVMIDFWRRQSGTESAAKRLRGQVEFGRWRSVTAKAADLLARSAALTEAGGEFLDGIRANLARWAREPLTARAAELADDLSTEHRARWRVRHLVPDPAAIESLAARWRSGDPPPASLAGVDVQLRPGSLPEVTANARAYLLALRHADPERLGRLLSDGNPASGWIDRTDRLLVTERHAAAAAGYRQRLASDGDPDLWAGLSVASRHVGSPRVAGLLADRPEVAAAVCSRLRDGLLDLAPVLAWLAGEP